MKARGFAKVNLSLRVHSPLPGGSHPITGIFQSIGWHDRLSLEGSDEDALSTRDGVEVIDGRHNLAWQAVTAVRSLVEQPGPVRVQLEKRIPVAAGLGGGSADAAAGLALAGRFYGVPGDGLEDLAPSIGSDVPFCLVGGRALVSGIGERVEPLEPTPPYGLALVVPPIELSTAAVYSAWDRLDGPSGPVISGADLPPGLRDDGPFGNDLYPAAVAVAREVDEWRSELAGRWGRPVLLTGSGPTLFAYFVDTDEAASAIEDIPPGARDVNAAVPVERGWEITSER